MKRKLRILVALVMSLTMMFGMSITAFAEEYWHPDHVNQCECDGSYSFASLVYIAETNVTCDDPEDPDYGDQGVLTYWYTSSDGNCASGSIWGSENHFLQGVELVVGKVYHLDDSSRKYVPCDCNPNPYLPPSPSPSPSPEPNGETPSAPSCDHDFQWQTVTSATATTYGTEGDVCSKCGATRNVRTKSPLDDWARMQINNAKPGDVLKLNFGPWNSYPLWMMQMIADKPTVTYIFNYTYQGNKYEVTIKPGDKFALDCKWYGPAKMPTLFDTVITKW